MELDTAAGLFRMTAEEQQIFHLPEHVTAWPVENADALFDRIVAAETDLADANPTTLPPAERAQAVATVTRRAELARRARALVASQITVDTAGLDTSQL
jgi:hypothetical protein